MRRDLKKLADNTFDLLIIGGGINGACAAWDATLRGLSVALVDKDDFGAATSANSLKIIHGGLRYLQSASIRRMRESIRERSTLMRIAPHLVHPLPFVVPTYGQSAQGKPALWTALKINDLVGFDRNRQLPPEKTIPNGRVISREECLGLFPAFERRRLTGGAMWYDCQVNNPERLTLSFLLSAAEMGAELANYTKVTELLTEADDVCGARAMDVLSGEELEIRARIVLNAAGPWVGEIPGTPRGAHSTTKRRPAMVLGINLVTRRVVGNVAIGLQSRTARDRDPAGRGNRFLFLTPWRQSTLIGTSYKVFHGDPDSLCVEKEDLQVLVDECNRACPALDLSVQDVSFYHRGLLPLKGEEERGRAQSLAEVSRIIDHERCHNLSGLVSIVGVKYTTARKLAQDAIDAVFEKLGRDPPSCRTSEVPLYSGDLTSGRTDPAPGDTTTAAGEVLRGEVVHAVTEEMALRLADVVFRRTNLGTEACPPREQLAAVTRIMAGELSWTEARQATEIDEVLHAYSPLQFSLKYKVERENHLQDAWGHRVTGTSLQRSPALRPAPGH